MRSRVFTRTFVEENDILMMRLENCLGKDHQMLCGKITIAVRLENSVRQLLVIVTVVAR
jgi:hypothetical protein